MSNTVKPEHPNKRILDIIEAHLGMFASHDYPKGRVIKSIGDHITEHWYVKSGLIKGWYIDDNIKREVIISFLWDNMFLSTDIHRKVELPIEVEVIKPTVLYTISEENFNKMKAKHPILDEYVDNNFKRMMRLLQEKSMIMNYNNLGKRYYELQKHYPFIKDFSNEELSYFLGCSKRAAATARYWTPPPKDNDKKKK